MKQFTQREFIKICMANGFHFERMSGDHAIYVNDKGRHISIPNHLRCVIAQRLIKENNLETNIKKLKKKMKESGYYPPGAEFDPDAPWNEPLPVNHHVFVSITISGYTDIEGSKEMTVEQMRDSIEEGLKDGIYPKDFDIDEIEVLEE